MRKILFFLVPAVVAGAVGFYLFAQPAEKKEVLPEIGKMTMDQLLNEFFNPRGETGIPAPQRRIDLINALRRLGAPLVERMRKDLKDPNVKVKTRAEMVLNNLGNVARPAVPELVAAMSDPSEDVRQWAVGVLGHLRDPRAFHALVNATHDPSPRVRSWVLRNATESLSDGAFATVVLALSDQDPGVRHSAIKSLWFLHDKRAVAFLAPLLEDAVVLSYSVERNGVKTATRNCDAVVNTLEYLVNGHPVFPGLDKGTQEEHDQAVKTWKAWWTEQGGEFVRKLYAEPELKRSLK